MQETADYQTYSQRVLCPCHGMLQVVSQEGGIAESVDGYNWKLFVADESIVSHTGLSEVRYGDWNLHKGCSRSRIRGTSASSLIEETGERLVEALYACAASVPFEPLDCHEYWLIDEARQRPLALLESCTRLDRPVTTDCPHWHPGAAAKRHFSSTFGNADSLANMIQQRAGRKPVGLWVERTGSGNGLLSNGEEIDRREFPELYLSTDWPSREQTHLVTDFLAWQAPWLLQIHDLIPATRSWLERAAWRRPMATSRIYRLFPRVFDTQGLTVTRVKARMMQDEPATDCPPEPFYPFYNE
ncbi:MAG: hypothetical protein QNJ78_00885 [Gammaproteobacteria bacterium]|nr:hypothetical protein [Gammaproteobacteria bacterium]